MKQKKVAIIAQSNIDWILQSDLKSYSYFIGVDRGAFVLLKKGIISDIAIGDFDSVTKKEMDEIRTKVQDVREYPQDKDKTDLELAVEEALKENPSDIVIYGGTGRRLDHEIAAFHFLWEIQKKNCQAILRDEHNEIRLVEKNCRMKNRNHFHFLSIIPFTEEIVVSIRGCRYPLSNHSMKRGTTLGVSNVIVSDYADITIHKGIAYCILSKDGRKLG